MSWLDLAMLAAGFAAPWVAVQYRPRPVPAPRVWPENDHSDVGDESEFPPPTTGGAP